MKNPCIWAAIIASSLMLAWSMGIADEESEKPALQIQRVLLENARVRVLEYRSRPAGQICGIGAHSHPPHVTVVLAAACDRATRSDGKVEEGDMQIGDVYWSDGETHTDVNIGKTNSYLIVLELKDPAPTPRH